MYVRHKSVNIRIFRVRLHDAINSRASERNGRKKKLNVKATRQISPIDKKRGSHWKQLVAHEWQRVSPSLACATVRAVYASYFPGMHIYACSSARGCLSLTNAREWKTAMRSSTYIGTEEWLTSRYPSDCIIMSQTATHDDALPATVVLRSDLFMNAPSPRSYVFIRLTLVCL